MTDDSHFDLQSNETALLLSTQRKDALIIEKLLKGGANPDFMTQVHVHVCESILI